MKRINAVDVEHDDDMVQRERRVAPTRSRASKPPRAVRLSARRSSSTKTGTSTRSGMHQRRKKKIQW